MTNEADKPASGAAPAEDADKPLNYRMKCDAFCPKCEHGLCKFEKDHPGLHACNMNYDHEWWTGWKAGDS